MIISVPSRVSGSSPASHGARKQVLVACAVALAGAGSACQKNEAAPPAQAATAASPAAPAPVAAPAAASRPAAPGIVIPEDVSADKPIAAAKLRAAIAAWYKKPVTVVGYATFKEGDSGTLSWVVSLASAPGSGQQKAVVDCQVMAPDRSKQVDNKTPLTLKGTVTAPRSERVTLEDCTVVAQGQLAKPDSLAAPGSPEPVSVDKLAAAYAGWFGKEVTAFGKGNGVTSSTDKDGKVTDVRVDVDLVDPEGRYKNQLGCHVASLDLVANIKPIMDRTPDSFTVRGKIARFNDERPQLEPCVVVSK